MGSVKFNFPPAAYMIKTQLLNKGSYYVSVATIKNCVKKGVDTKQEHEDALTNWRCTVYGVTVMCDVAVHT